MIHKCPDCEYSSPHFASVAMHFIRCHHVPKSSAASRVRKLKSEVAMLRHAILGLRKENNL